MIEALLLRAVAFTNAVPYGHLGLVHLLVARRARRMAAEKNVRAWGLAEWAALLAEQHEADARGMFAEARKCLGVGRSR